MFSLGEWLSLTLDDMGNTTPYRKYLSYQQLAFDEYVRARQGTLEVELPQQDGSIDGFEFEATDKKLIRQADHFFISTVTGSGWPYVQHRGGPAGFVHFLSETQLAWVELVGNNQFVSTGNVDREGRVALFFIDYPTRTRLKVFGYARVVEGDDDPELMRTVRRLGDREIRSVGHRVMVVDVVAADRNCTKHIKPRWTKDYIDELIGLYRADIIELKEAVALLEEEKAQLQARARQSEEFR